MKTLDFTATHSNTGDNPLRAEQLRIASGLDLLTIDVDVFWGPPGDHGFRRGMWNAKHEGRRYQFFSSVPHAADLDTQRNMLKEAAALHIAGLRSGYIGVPACPETAEA